MLYFLPEDIIKLEASITKTRENLEEGMKNMGNSCEGEANTWHDNFAFEEAQRQVDMWLKRLHDLQRMCAKVRIVYPPEDNHSVEIGHIVVIKDLDTNEMRTVRMGSYMCFRSGEDDITISYAAPLGQMLMNARVGDIRSGKTGKGLKRFQIMEIK